MKPSTTLALSAIVLAAIVHGKPMVHEHLHKRDLVTTTVWEEVTETVDVFVTVYGSGNSPQANLNLNPGNNALDRPAEQPAPQPTSQPLPQVENKLAELSSPAPEVPAQTTAPVQQGPAQQQTTQQQPSPFTQQQQPDPSPQQSHQPQHTQSGTLPSPDEAVGTGSSGGSCGSVGGKCMASDVTVHPESGIGACGWTNNTNSEDFFALSLDTFGTYSNDAPGPHKNPFCGRMAAISANGGPPVHGMLTDRCDGCKGLSIDLSQSLWNKVFPGMENTRVHNIEWSFIGPEIYHAPSG
ncbi:MAG: hypothetical protein Q9163_002514 [Psora crenata]